MRVKGVTPVVATVLLLFIAVAAVGSAAVFLEGAIEGVQEGADDQLEREQLVEASDLTINAAYNSSGYLFFDVRNTGSVTMPINESGERVWSLFIDGRPQNNWRMLTPQNETNPNEIVSINTSTSYPVVDESVEILVTAPYETRDSYICYNTGSLQC